MCLHTWFRVGDTETNTIILAGVCRCYGFNLLNKSVCLNIFLNIITTFVLPEKVIILWSKLRELKEKETTARACFRFVGKIRIEELCVLSSQVFFQTLCSFCCLSPLHPSILEDSRRIAISTRCAWGYSSATECLPFSHACDPRIGLLHHINQIN